ncbi:hypothetical protein PSACC_00908 [Paramicrosporidium saccamoebae]|uniref:Mitochondrial ATPase complex subunit ATP10 n=1 Tax=Paramicrosporidium saccamoebae TaxID=1246581 RepID=A0A2H9TNC2_9FUNG|nr:hypothetical protein PSACC_00908 [Paramicrosporidium saccamoebae]
MAKSPVAEISDILKSQGKFFSASQNVITPIALPEWTPTTITGNELSLRGHCMGHVTLLTICFTAYSEPHLESFRRPFLEAGGRLIDVRPLMSRIKWLLFSRLLRSTALATLPESIQNSFIVAYRPMQLLDTLTVPNYLGAYVYLIDRHAQVRWKASGKATEAELAAMKRITKELLSEK